MPFAFFPLEMIEAYPEAKIILNTREFKPWYESFLKTIWPVKDDQFLRLLFKFNLNFQYGFAEISSTLFPDFLIGRSNAAGVRCLTSNSKVTFAETQNESKRSTAH